MKKSLKVFLSIFLCFAVLFVSIFVDYYRARALAISTILGVSALAGMLIAGGYLMYNKWDSVYPLLSKTWNDLEEGVKQAILLPVEAGKAFIAYSPVVWGSVLTSLVNNKDVPLQETINEAKNQIVPIQFDPSGGVFEPVLNVGHQYRLKYTDRAFDTHDITIRVLSSLGGAYSVYLSHYEDGWYRWSGHGVLSLFRFTYRPEDTSKYTVELKVNYGDDDYHYIFSYTNSIPEFYDDGVVIDTTYDPDSDDVQVTVPPLGDLNQEAQKRAKDTKVYNPKSSAVSDVSSLVQYLDSLESVNQELYKDIYDLEKEQTGLLGDIVSALTGVASSVSAIASTLTDGLVGDLSIDYAPLMDLPITTKFPFSLPFDVYNAISGFSVSGDLPEVNFGFYNPVDKTVISNRIDLGSIDFIVDYAPYVRAVLLFGYVLGLVHLTRRLLGGGV